MCIKRLPQTIQYHTFMREHQSNQSHAFSSLSPPWRPSVIRCIFNGTTPTQPRHQENGTIRTQRQISLGKTSVWTKYFSLSSIFSFHLYFQGKVANRNVLPTAVSLVEAAVAGRRGDWEISMSMNAPRENTVHMCTCAYFKTKGIWSFDDSMDCLG